MVCPVKSALSKSSTLTPYERLSDVALLSSMPTASIAYPSYSATVPRGVPARYDPEYPVQFAFSKRTAAPCVRG